MVVKQAGDAVALLAGQQTCDSRVRDLAGHHCLVALGKLLTLCASVTKQYNLVLTKEGISGWKSSRVPGGK